MARSALELIIDLLIVAIVITAALAIVFGRRDASGGETYCRPKAYMSGRSAQLYAAHRFDYAHHERRDFYHAKDQAKILFFVGAPVRAAYYEEALRRERTPIESVSGGSLSARCVSCHQGEDAPLGIRFDKLPIDPEIAMRAMAAMRTGRMPPAGELSPADRDAIENEILGRVRVSE